MRKLAALSLCLCLLLAACGTGGGPATTSLAPASTPAPSQVQPPVPSSLPASAADSAPAAASTEDVASTPPAEPLAGEITFPLPQSVSDRMAGVSWQKGGPVGLEELAYLRLPCVDFSGGEYLGEMVVHNSVATEVLDIFTELYEAGFPIEGMRLIDEYDADDMASMAANNSSCFCARLILGTERWSVHSYGAAIDINPVQNPYVTGGAVYPEAAAGFLDRDEARPGMILEDGLVYQAFTSRGWTWGGHWANPDYQHFEKAI